MHGVLTAMITPFAGDRIDEDSFIQNLRNQIQSEVAGVVILGTTGEAPALSWEESERLIEIAVAEAKDHLPVYVGVGTNSTRTTIERAQRAEALGADGLLVVCPYYNKPTQNGLVEHFSQLVQATSLPIILYNHPGRTGTHLEVSSLARLAELPSIIGVKEASGDLSQVEAIIATVCASRPDFLVYSGDDPMTLPMMALGVHGVISIASNLVPEAMNALVHAGLNGELAEARAWHYRLRSLFQACTVETNPIPIKALMHLVGFGSDACRLPLTRLTEGSREQMQQVIEEMKEYLPLPVNAE